MELMSMLLRRSPHNESSPNLAEHFQPPPHNDLSHTPGKRASNTRPPTRPAKLFGWTTLASFSFAISGLEPVIKHHLPRNQPLSPKSGVGGGWGEYRVVTPWSQKTKMPNFPHEMLREIYEQPDALTRTIDLYLSAQGLKPDVAAKLAGWPNPAG